MVTCHKILDSTAQNAMVFILSITKNHWDLITKICTSIAMVAWVLFGNMMDLGSHKNQWQYIAMVSFQNMVPGSLLLG